MVRQFCFKKNEKLNILKKCEEHISKIMSAEKIVISYFSLSKIEKMILVDELNCIQIPYEHINLNISQEKDFSKLNLIDVVNKVKEDISQQPK